MSSIVSASIDLTKIEESKVIEKNGKRWLNLTISINDTTDTYGKEDVIAIVEKSRATGLTAEYLIEQFKKK